MNKEIQKKNILYDRHHQNKHSKSRRNLCDMSMDRLRKLFTLAMEVEDIDTALRVISHINKRKREATNE